MRQPLFIPDRAGFVAYDASNAPDNHAPKSRESEAQGCLFQYRTTGFHHLRANTRVHGPDDGSTFAKMQPDQPIDTANNAAIPPIHPDDK